MWDVSHFPPGHVKFSFLTFSQLSILLIRLPGVSCPGGKRGIIQHMVMESESNNNKKLTLICFGVLFS